MKKLNASFFLQKRVFSYISNLKNLIYVIKGGFVMNRRELKENAKENMKGTFTSYLLGGFLLGVMMALAQILSYFPLVGIFGLVLLYYFAIAYWYGRAYFVAMADKGDVCWKDIFSMMDSEHKGNTIGTICLTAIFQLLWSLLFVIPGLVKTYSYLMVPYILVDNPELSPTEVITLSREMMNGRKLDAFVLHLSFIPWVLIIVALWGVVISISTAALISSMSAATSGGASFVGVALLFILAVSIIELIFIVWLEYYISSTQFQLYKTLEY